MSKKDQLRDIDQVVLQKAAEGVDTTRRISEETTFETHRIRYSLKKLDRLGLLDVEREDGWEEDVIDGQRRVFQASLQGKITKKGRQILEVTRQKDLAMYEDLSRIELVEKVHRLETRVDRLEDTIEAFRKQVLQKLEEEEGL